MTANRNAMTMIMPPLFFSSFLLGKEKYGALTRASMDNCNIMLMMPTKMSLKTMSSL